jgi:hypothetical protein
LPSTRRYSRLCSSVHDSRRYSIEHLVGLPRLDYNPETKRYVLVDSERQLSALDDALRATMPERAGSTRTLGEAGQAEARRRTQQEAAWAQPAPARAAQPTGPGRSARVTKRSAARAQQLGAQGRERRAP